MRRASYKATIDTRIGYRTEHGEYEIVAYYFVILFSHHHLPSMTYSVYQQSLVACGLRGSSIVYTMVSRAFRGQSLHIYVC